MIKHSMNATRCPALLALVTTLAWTYAPGVHAQEQAIQLEELRAEAYQQALEAAAMEQRDALEAVESARAELARQARQQRDEAEVRQLTEQTGQQAAREAAQREAIRAREQELRGVQRELERAHAKLRQASQEVARVHRELNRADRGPVPPVPPGANRAVIGIILGSNAGEGVQVLGLSPDGPAERAGIRQGDVIVALMGEPLGEDNADSRELLFEAMQSVEPGDELSVTVLRDGQRVDTTVIAEQRTPFSWQSVTRLSSAPLPPPAPAEPGQPGIPVAPVAPTASIQVIEVPGVNLEQLEREIEIVRERLGEQSIIIERIAPAADGHRLVYDLDEFSAVGDAALAGTGLWFGLRLARGLSLAELNPDLGAYFGAERGVLVLSAADGNELQLRAGDVIISIDGRVVERPADVMRALRAADSDAPVNIELRREQRLETLEITMLKQVMGSK
jgi:C-terminal processing protease CtpA/Prc